MPKQLNERCQEFVASLIDYFERERDNKGPLLPLTAVRERVAAALNLSMYTVSAISLKKKKNEALKSPRKRKTTKRVTNTSLLDTGAIRNTIYTMYERRQHITLSSLLEKLREKELFNGCRMSLCSLLKEIGFKWKKDDPRRGLLELSNIALKRVDFLRSYIKNKEESLYKFVFLDETWIFKDGTISHSWQDDNVKSVKTTKVNGKRHIILHAGNEDGFIEGAELVFSSKSQNDDYHGEMNSSNFLHWFEYQLLYNLTEPSLIIMDNAPYHNVLLTKIPNSSWKKGDIQDWLFNNNIEFCAQMLKSELLRIVARNKPESIFVVDQLAEQYGHKVLRLPPYHCMFNPIELIWGISKSYYNKHVGKGGTSNEDCLNMWRKALLTVTPEIWKNSIKHTENEIRKWFNREHLFDRQEIQPIIINIGNDSESSSYDSD